MSNEYLSMEEDALMLVRAIFADSCRSQSTFLSFITMDETNEFKSRQCKEM